MSPVKPVYGSRKGVRYGMRNDVMNGMPSRRRRLLAERERDIAIEEAAMEAFEAARLREQVTALRREKAEWEASRDEWRRRQEQVLWHVGAMAETIWRKIQGDREHVSVEQARLVALESFERLALKSDPQLYEEMHDLYAKIASMEAQHTQLLQKIQEMKRVVEELEEASNARTKCDCRDEETQISHATELAKDDERNTDSAVDSHHPDRAMAMHPTTGGIKPKRAHEDGGRDRREETDAAGGILPLSSQNGASRTPGGQQGEDDANVAILQAQLATYISFVNRQHLTSARAKPMGRIER